MSASVKSEQFRPVTGKETHALKSKSQKGNQTSPGCLKSLQLLYIYTQLNVCTWMYLRKNNRFIIILFKWMSLSALLKLLYCTVPLWSTPLTDFLLLFIHQTPGRKKNRHTHATYFYTHAHQKCPTSGRPKKLLSVNETKPQLTAVISECTLSAILLFFPFSSFNVITNLIFSCLNTRGWHYSLQWKRKQPCGEM